MFRDTPEGRELITSVSKDIVAAVAPEELPLFEELAAEYFADPRPPKKTGRAQDDPLGFGLSEALVVVTPAASAMVTAAFTHILAEIFKSTKDEESKKLREKIKSIVYKDKSAEPLNLEQLEEVRKVAFEQARLFGIPENQAHQMADALVGRLVMKK
jgi:hypothetical protein